MTHGRNEFPIRISLEDIGVIASSCADTWDNAEYINLQMRGVTQRELCVIEVIRRLHGYMLERRVDPGFQVVLGE